MRIAIVRLTSLGDVVHTLPVAAALRRCRPCDEILWIAEEHEQALLVGNPCVDRVAIAPLRRWRTWCSTGRVWRAVDDFRAFAAALRSSRIEVVIDVQGWWHKTSAIVGLTRAGCRIGFSRRYARDPVSPLFTTVHVTPPPGATHVVEQNLALLKPLGIESPSAEFVLPAWPDAEQRVVAWMASRRLQAHRFIVLLPSARAKKKLWPAAAYAELGRRLGAAARLPIVVAGGPSDQPLLATVAASADDAQVYAPEGISDLAVFLTRPRMVVGNDTGPLHLAAAAGVPALGLFWPTSGVRNGPYGPHGRFVQSGTGRMTDIRLEEVFETSLRLLAS